MVNSGFLNGMTVKEAIPAMKKYVVEQGFGKEKVNYKLRDWVFSRQRYWGEPIPLVHCDEVRLGARARRASCRWSCRRLRAMSRPTTARAPLSKMTDWVNTTCPHCGGPAKRETDTMPQWAGSSWYFLRYMDPAQRQGARLARRRSNTGAPSTGTTAAWSTPRFTCSIPASGTSSSMTSASFTTKEPYAKRTSHGMILGRTRTSRQARREKMRSSKYGTGAAQRSRCQSLGNVVNPDDVVKAYGADTMRLYIMFIGDFEKAVTWSNEAVKGSKRFLDRCWNLMDMIDDDEQISEKNARHRPQDHSARSRRTSTS